MVVAYSLLVSALAASAYAKSPSNSYAPGSVDCPPHSPVRVADGISRDEKDYLRTRWQNSNSALKDFVSRQNLEGIDVEDLFWFDDDGNKNGVNIGIAIPGGGFRSLIMGGGAIQSMDDREEKKGSLSGLLQGASHITGVSGGAWLVGSMYLNDFPTISQLRNNKNIWKFNNDLITPGNDFRSTLVNYANIAGQLLAKQASGHPITITDLWGRFLSYEMVDSNNGGPAMEWSDLANLNSFKRRFGPFPIILANGVDGDTGAAINSTLYEITPFEIGSFGPSLRAFAQLKYLGSDLDNGHSNDACVSGYDNAGFMMGTSSSLFNSLIRTAVKYSGSNIISALGSVAAQLLDNTGTDVAVVRPNPFKNFKPQSYISNTDIADAEQLSLVDGATSGEYAGVWPLLRKERKIDVVIALDVSTETKKLWPAGKTLLHTYSRYLDESNDANIVGNAARVNFPKVPDSNSFVNLGLTTRPTFFGCYAKDYANVNALRNGQFGDVPPIVVYVANTPMGHMTNATGMTTPTHINNDDAQSMFENGFQLFDQPQDSDWPTCVACATIQRERERQGDLEPTEQCKECFNKYCWDGRVDPRDPEVAGLHNDPTYKLEHN